MLKIVLILIILLIIIYSNNNIDNYLNYVDNDKELNIDILYKNCEKLYSIQSKYQLIEVFKHNILGNILVIDNDIQLTEKDEYIYHEMMVHVPINYLKSNDINVLIIGGGDGGTLRELLKYNNVINVNMVEIDNEVIRAARLYFKKLSISFNDKRAKLYIEDGVKWVKKNIENKKNNFNLIIIDSTDFGASEGLFTYEFYNNVKKLLKKDGILVFNYKSLGLHTDNIYDLIESKIGKLFKYRYIYQASIPTYHGGHYSFAFLSNSINPKNTYIDWNNNISTKYYNKNIHIGSFNLPNKLIKEFRGIKDKIGITVTFDIYNVDSKYSDNMKYINKVLDILIKNINITEVKRMKHKFKPQGLTMISLLKESHLSIHTWPEKKYIAIDIFTCGKYNLKTNNILLNLLKKYFETDNIKIGQIDRYIR